MLGLHGRKPAQVIVEPVAKLMIKLKVTPNQLTLVSAGLTVGVALLLIPTGHLIWAAVLTGLFAAFDMIDGTVARMQGGGTKFGATLMPRVTASLMVHYLVRLPGGWCIPTMHHRHWSLPPWFVWLPPR